MKYKVFARISKNLSAFRRHLIIVAVALLAVGFTSCSKDQKAVKTLEGDWEEVTVDGTTVPDSLKGVLHFDFCKLKKDEWCKMNYTDNDGVNSGDYDYKITDKGTMMTQKIEDPSKGSIQITGDIEELTDTKLVLEMNIFGIITNTEYKKL